MSRRHIEINLEPSEQRQFDSYGLVFVGTTYHKVNYGLERKRGPFQIRVFENRTSWRDGKPTGEMVDAHGHPTKDEYSYLLSEQSVMIASTPVETPPYGDDIRIGDAVTLLINNYRLGRFIVGQGVGLYDITLTSVGR